ncbi:uncharacterized protein B0P05DRAFT_477612 [Gilbertella persicaria]|uniref:TRP C-terminal domain-containing protein n=1 Tax=Rhizopus stolonifer TaxID=4846 RepID=A0A367KKM2_RHIST|nr:uncharacterized protein B0P05DRAFT_477612 [Gilbertella persicaria]KAI8061528.1 hypothetical protein B0P05DRAFT_477612 [Gilbertella persicaria]RCI02785.1 hypothetical protein CU098_012046 [Rhizopus stolonifer]
MGISNTTVTNLNTQGSTSSASMFELKFGFQTLHIPSHQFCLDSACPIPNGQQFIVQRSFNLSSIPLYPLADITAKYSAVDADSNHLVCITLAPVGYQHPVWQKIFMYLPIGLTASAAIISLIGSFITFEDSEHDIFLFSSNYAMLPGILRLKTPGFFDLVFYAQFIVIAGQFNIDYPRFHPLFTSNFSWSFLLFRSEWLQDTIKTIFRGQSSPLQEIASVPGNSLYRRQISNGTDTNKINILGTGMLNFAMATGIDINAMFFTFLVYFLLVFTCCAVCCFLTWLVLFAIAKMNEDEAFTAQCKKVWDFSIGKQQET